MGQKMICENSQKREISTRQRFTGIVNWMSTKNLLWHKHLILHGRKKSSSEQDRHVTAVVKVGIINKNEINYGS